ncbi:cation-translocating P-type ATPase [Pseudanabaena sp. BC1403]|uniref:cation-translocating P-type ATPase n=1 Tax=Pseudanabaena sp. BC1403 TaxID=2043171 RepID=UPI000CD811D4|nr:cation-translocating P-type ATPase [Pseudanabaena sp. BC1403]
MKSVLNPQELTGLSEQEVSQRLQTEGYNELPTSDRRNIWGIILEIASEPIFLLLLGCGGIYLFLGDTQEALILLGFVFFIVGINLYQEQKTEKSLEALRDLSSPRALVIRDGDRKRIAGREVVRGDLIVLAEGDRVPADGVLLWSTHLTVDESLLTGESLPVRKAAVNDQVDLPANRPGGDDLPYVYSGTLAVQGQAIVEVQAIGQKTEMGKIGKALQTIEQEDSKLQKETRRIVKQLTIIAIAICVAAVVIYGITRGDWLNGVLAGLALGMAILPNEIPVVLAIFLALGAWRFSQQNVLTRRIPVVETLGSATVLCVDKTGTLTLNQMTVQQLFVYQEESNNPAFYDLTLHKQELLPEDFHLLIEYGILASRKDPFDPMEKALKLVGQELLSGTEHLHEDWDTLREYPLSGTLRAMSCVWEPSEGGEKEIAAKGAPEAIADLCHFSPEAIANLEKQVNVMASSGLRVLGVAKGFLSKDSDRHVSPADGSLPADQHDFDFKFIGLVGLSDPVRPTVAHAIAECYQAGIRVVMITGDYPSTAQNIAMQIGLSGGEVITGTELEQMTEEQLRSRIRSTNIFARVVPEQKLLIVNALKQSGEIVAMTGDGVNDAPALKAANIGIAMGGRGTDVARESADLVLLNDDFNSIVASVKLGRRIFDNLKKGMAYTLAVHIPIAGISLVPIIMQWPLVLLPIHIAFLHLIIDPACTIAFEAEPAEANVMQRPPRNPKEPLFDKRTLRLAFFQGLSVLGVLVIVYSVAYYQGHFAPDVTLCSAKACGARSLVFTTLIVSNLAMILTNRSWTKTIFSTMRISNPSIWWIIGGGAAFLGLILYIPFLRQLFQFSYLNFEDLAIALLSGIASVIWFELLKWKTTS